MHKKSKLVAILLMIVGVSIRCAHLLLMDFVHEPFRLGGLFAAFAEEITNNGFRLPVTIPYYSSGGIPFAYPPLGFYVEAALLKFFPSQVFLVANLLPLLVSILVLGLAAWFFHFQAGGWNLRSLSALGTYALLPNAFFNQIEAAGLAEAFGSLALFVFPALVMWYQQKRDTVSVLFSGLSLAFCIYASPGSALGAAAVFMVLVFDTVFLVRWTQHARPYMQLFYMGVAGAILSAPYWLTVIKNHGVNIFLTPLQVQYQTNGTNSLLGKLQANWFTYGVLQQDGVYFWSFAILLGISWLVWRKKWFMPLVFLTLFSIPRENTWLTAFPVAVLVSHGVADVLVPRLGPLSGLKLTSVKVACGILFFTLGFQAWNVVNAQVMNEDWKLPPIQAEALYQAREIIPSYMQVIVVGNGALREWAPYLLQREVINTEFGLEWQPDEYDVIIQFNKVLDEAGNWQDVNGLIQLSGGRNQVYVVMDPGHLPERIGMFENDLLEIKMDTPELVVGILDLR